MYTDTGIDYDMNSSIMVQWNEDRKPAELKAPSIKGLQEGYTPTASMPHVLRN